MTALFRPRQRTEVFAARVDGADRVVRADAEVERLVGVATTLRTFAESPVQQAVAAPRDEFVADLRARLLAETAVVLTPENRSLRLPERRRGTRERKLVAVATAAVILGGTAGVATAAQSALPGDALYPLKRGIERAETGLASNDAGRGRDLLSSATDRLDEVDRLLARRAPTASPQIPGTLHDFSAQAREGSGLLLTSYDESQDPATIDAVRRFAADGLATLRAMSTTAPPDARDELRDAANTLRDIDRQARALCDSCSDLPPLHVPRLFLVSADAQRALARAGSDATPLDNSHPVIVPKDALHAVEEVGSRLTNGATSGPAPAPGGSSPTTGPQGPALPTPTGSPKIRVRVEINGKGVDTGDGLDQTVKTLLPDPDGLLP
ncbi:MAG: hypothetical protein HOQ22_01740 [Nocardioidaceae bacterium]|nr:hypothetical protein [Nocardioidaceae bacterium]NUS49746.1 hypothetical protein [Nocardioidaceae bacterium]